MPWGQLLGLQADASLLLAGPAYLSFVLAPAFLILGMILLLMFNTDAIAWLATRIFGGIVRRYERASLIVTSNKSFLDWGEIFNDQVLATAILDRLLLAWSEQSVADFFRAQNGSKRR